MVLDKSQVQRCCRMGRLLFGRLLFLIMLLFALSVPAKRKRLSHWNIPAANYSGIAHIGNEKYVVVSDVETKAGFYIWTLSVDLQKGKIKEVRNEGFRGVEWPSDRDAEGIAFCGSRQTLFVSGEADQRILEHGIDGGITGQELQVPIEFSSKSIQSNRGFEALGYDAKNQVFWTCTESPTLAVLKSDSSSRLIMMQSFASNFQPLQQYAYYLDEPQAKRKGADYYHGVVAITPLNDATLLVLEREALIAKRGNGSRCWVKLFRYHPESGKKQFVYEWKSRFNLFNTRFANYEGMCLGPILLDGTQTLLLLSDSQAGIGKAFWHLKDYVNIIRLPHFSNP